MRGRAPGSLEREPFSVMFPSPLVAKKTPEMLATGGATRVVIVVGGAQVEFTADERKQGNK